MATVTKNRTRKQRTINPYYRKHDNWYYACSQRFVPMFGRERVKLIKGDKCRENDQLAIVELRQLLQRVEADTLQDGMPILLLAEKYLEWQKGEVLHTTWKQSRHAISVFCGKFGNKTVAEFNDSAKANMHKWLSENSPDGCGPCNWKSRDSKRHAIKLIKAMFN